jgi:8-oxo-dGTP pyrophosphatase MutT (NUDIX family)
MKLWKYNRSNTGRCGGLFVEGLTEPVKEAGGGTTAVSCGGVVIFKGKVLLLYKNQNGKYIGWVMPKGALEPDETHKQAALREVKEESGVTARAIKYIGKTQYSFQGAMDVIKKTVHWYLMTTGSFYCKPQAEEFFTDAGYYKQHEAYHLLKFHDEKQIMRRAFAEYGEYRNTREYSGNNKLFLNSRL